MLSGKKIAFVNSWANKYWGIYTRWFGERNEIAWCLPTCPDDLRGAQEWADIVWCLFANEPLVALSNAESPSSGLIASVRVYEMMPGETGFFPATCWKNVRGLLYESPHVQSLTETVWGEILGDVPRRMIWDCVWLDEYPFYNKGVGHNLAYIGHINFKKGWPLLLQALRHAVNIDSRYRLFVAGDFQSFRHEAYIKHMVHAMGLSEHIQFDGWVDDIQPWLIDKDYLISASEWEGCPKGIIEAMACGVVPLIHNFVGADGVFPTTLLWDTLDEFGGMLGRKDAYVAQFCRDYVADKFNAEKQMPLMDEFIEEALRGRSGDDLPSE